MGTATLSTGGTPIVRSMSRPPLALKSAAALRQKGNLTARMNHFRLKFREAIPFFPSPVEEA